MCYNKLEMFNLNCIVLNSQIDSPEYYRIKNDPTLGI
jgi:hypothetical protein